MQVGPTIFQYALSEFPLNSKSHRKLHYYFCNANHLGQFEYQLKERKSQGMSISNWPGLWLFAGLFARGPLLNPNFRSISVNCQAHQESKKGPYHGSRHKRTWVIKILLRAHAQNFVQNLKSGILILSWLPAPVFTSKHLLLILSLRQIERLWNFFWGGVRGQVSRQEGIECEWQFPLGEGEAFCHDVWNWWRKRTITAFNGSVSRHCGHSADHTNCKKKQLVLANSKTNCFTACQKKKNVLFRGSFLCLHSLCSPPSSTYYWSCDFSNFLDE